MYPILRELQISAARLRHKQKPIVGQSRKFILKLGIVCQPAERRCRRGRCQMKSFCQYMIQEAYSNARHLPRTVSPAHLNRTHRSRLSADCDTLSRNVLTERYMTLLTGCDNLPHRCWMYTRQAPITSQHSRLHPGERLAASADILDQ